MALHGKPTRRDREHGVRLVIIHPQAYLLLFRGSRTRDAAISPHNSDRQIIVRSPLEKGVSVFGSHRLKAFLVFPFGLCYDNDCIYRSWSSRSLLRFDLWFLYSSECWCYWQMLYSSCFRGLVTLVTVRVASFWNDRVIRRRLRPHRSSEITCIFWTNLD